MIELKDIYKIYSDGDSEIRALDGMSLNISEGEFVAIEVRSVPYSPRESRPQASTSRAKV